MCYNYDDHGIVDIIINCYERGIVGITLSIVILSCYDLYMIIVKDYVLYVYIVN